MLTPSLLGSVKHLNQLFQLVREVRIYEGDKRREGGKGEGRGKEGSWDERGRKGGRGKEGWRDVRGREGGRKERGKPDKTNSPDASPLLTS